MNDIRIYLEDNRERLPHGSEVSVDELFKLMERNAKELQTALTELNTSKQWVKGILE